MLVFAMITRREGDNAARAGEHFVRIDSLVSVPFEVSHFTSDTAPQATAGTLPHCPADWRRHATIVKPSSRARC